MDEAFRQAFRSPLTAAQVDAWIEELQEWGVPLRGLNILNAVTDELGLCSEMAVLLVQSVEARVNGDPLCLNAGTRSLPAWISSRRTASSQGRS